MYGIQWSVCSARCIVVTEVVVAVLLIQIVVDVCSMWAIRDIDREVVRKWWKWG